MAKKQVTKNDGFRADSATKMKSGQAIRVVGIGASAGGLEAFTEMLRGLPADIGMGFVFVQHLDPKHVSTLTEILARETAMPVAEARNGMRIRPGHAYVIPRNTSMTVAGGILRVGPRSVLPGRATSIDVFFHSMAIDFGERAIGVVLSGSAGDGTAGLKAIKEAGGITLAQTPQSAKYDSMPRNAIASGCVDLIRSPAEIAQELIRLGKHLEAVPAVTANQAAATNGIASAVALLRSATGVDFSNYKTNTIHRRIARRMALRRSGSITEYLELLRADSAEVQALYEDVLINVTEFFRDPEVFTALKTSVFSKLTPKKASGGDVRIWIPACSTGEEVYSIAIALLEYLDNRAENFSIQIFATDISDTALEKARAGIYPASIAHTVSAERLRTFFVNVESGYQIVKRVREMCVFAKHNLAKDPPFSRLNLISCRNLLIYMDQKLQSRVLPTLHYALKADGFLLLGSAETVGRHGEYFLIIDKKHKIYGRKGGPITRIPMDFSSPKMPGERLDPPRRMDPWNESEVQRETDRMIVQRFGPPGVVIDDDLEILQFRGQTSPFIEPAAGRASLNLLKMVREWLSHELKQVIGRVRKTNAAARRNVSNEGVGLTIEVIPFKRRNESARKYLVLFERDPAEKKLAVKPGAKQSAVEVRALERDNVQLKHELAATKDHLQSVLEDHDAAGEELRSASEEIQSSNEELQSTNEELETAKEELQSTNEELNTLNEELQTRNLQLTQTGNDLLNLLANVQMPILILANDLRIRRFTPLAEKVLNLIPADVGRPISDINLGIKLPDLKRSLLDVTENLVSKIMDVQDAEGRRYSLRMRPYRTEDNKIDGVVMVLVDVDPESRWAEDGMQSAIDRLTTMNRQQIAGVEGMRSALAAGRDDLRSLASTLLQAQEEERRRLSHELHDELNQKLALLELNIQNLQHRASPIPAAVREELEGFRKTVGELSDDLRRIAYRLHPSILEDLGLIVALQSYCEEFSGREGIQVRFKHKDVPAVAPRTIALCLYRVAQESLRNVAKHSGAKRATVTLNGSDGAVELTVRDGGSGFVLNQARLRGALGMLGMEERVRLVRGSIAWSTRPGGGTSVKVRVPLSESLPTDSEPEDREQPRIN